MFMNWDKTHAIHFTNKTETHSDKPQLYVDGNDVKFETSTKILGVIS